MSIKCHIITLTGTETLCKCEDIIMESRITSCFTGAKEELCAECYNVYLLRKMHDGISYYFSTRHKKNICAFHSLEYCFYEVSHNKDTNKI